MLAGCGSGKRASLADCLNAKAFLVQGDAAVVRGSSPGGVNFTLTVYPSPAAAERAFTGKNASTASRLGRAVADYTGDPPTHPGGPPGKLSKPALAAIRGCLVDS